MAFTDNHTFAPHDSKVHSNVLAHEYYYLMTREGNKCVIIITNTTLELIMIM